MNNNLNDTIFFFDIFMYENKIMMLQIKNIVIKVQGLNHQILCFSKVLDFWQS